MHRWRMGAPVGGPQNADQVVSEAPAAKTTIGPPLQARWSSPTILDARRARLPDRLMMGLYVKPIEWSCPSVDMLAPSPDEA